MTTYEEDGTLTIPSAYTVWRQATSSNERAQLPGMSMLRALRDKYGSETAETGKRVLSHSSGVVGLSRALCALCSLRCCGLQFGTMKQG